MYNKRHSSYLVGTGSAKTREGERIMKKKLIDIIRELGNKDYPYIEFRELAENYEGEVVDSFKGSASCKDGILETMDIEDYSLDDEFDRYEETVATQGTLNGQINEGDNILTVWTDRTERE